MAKKKQSLVWNIDNQDAVRVNIVTFTEGKDKGDAQSITILPGSPINPQVTGAVTLTDEALHTEVRALRADNGFPVCSLGAQHLEMDPEDDDFDDSLDARQVSRTVIPDGANQQAIALFQLVKKSLADPFSYTAKHVEQGLERLLTDENYREALQKVLQDFKLRGQLPETIKSSLHDPALFGIATTIVADYLESLWAYFDPKQTQTFYVYPVSASSPADNLPELKPLATITVTPPDKGIVDVTTPTGGYHFIIQDMEDTSEEKGELVWQEGKLAAAEIASFMSGFINRELIYAGQVTENLPPADKNVIVTFFIGTYREQLVVAIPEKIIPEKSIDDYISQGRAHQAELERETREHQEKITALKKKLAQLKEQQATRFSAEQRELKEAQKALTQEKAALKKLRAGGAANQDQAAKCREAIGKIKARIKELTDQIAPAAGEAAYTEQELAERNAILATLQESQKTLEAELDNLSAEEQHPDKKPTDQIPKKTGHSSLWIWLLAAGGILLISIATSIAWKKGYLRCVANRFRPRAGSEGENYGRSMLGSKVSHILDDSQRKRDTWIRRVPEETPPEEVEKEEHKRAEVIQQVEYIMRICAKVNPGISMPVVKILTNSALHLAEELIENNIARMPKFQKEFDRIFTTDIRGEISNNRDKDIDISNEDVDEIGGFLYEEMIYRYDHLVQRTSNTSLEKFKNSILISLDQKLSANSNHGLEYMKVVRLTDDTADIIFRLLTNYDDSTLAQEARSSVETLLTKWDEIALNPKESAAEKEYCTLLKSTINNLLPELTQGNISLEGRMAIIKESGEPSAEQRQYIEQVINVIKDQLMISDGGLKFSMERGAKSGTIFDMKRSKSAEVEALFSHIDGLDAPHKTNAYIRLNRLRQSVHDVIRQIVGNKLSYEQFQRSSVKYVETRECVHNIMEKLHQEYPAEPRFEVAPRQLVDGDGDSILPEELDKQTAINFISDSAIDNVVLYQESLSTVEFATADFKQALEANLSKGQELVHTEEICHALSDIISESYRQQDNAVDIYKIRCWGMEPHERNIVRQTLEEVYDKLVEQKRLRYFCEKVDDEDNHNRDPDDVDWEETRTKVYEDLKQELVSRLTQPDFMTRHANVIPDGNKKAANKRFADLRANILANNEKKFLDYITDSASINEDLKKYKDRISNKYHLYYDNDIDSAQLREQDKFYVNVAEQLSLAKQEIEHLKSVYVNSENKRFNDHLSDLVKLTGGILEYLKPGHYAERLANTSEDASYYKETLTNLYGLKKSISGAIDNAKADMEYEKSEEKRRLHQAGLSTLNRMFERIRESLEKEFPVLEEEMERANKERTNHEVEEFRTRAIE